MFMGHFGVGETDETGETFHWLGLTTEIEFDSTSNYWQVPQVAQTQIEADCGDIL